jgi:adenylylsulfate kinase-like enzyme
MSILWLTGNCDAGKTGLSLLLKERIPNVVLLDGDEMRATISVDCGFSEADRSMHNQRVLRLARLLSGQGLFVIISVIAPFQSTRDLMDEMADINWVYVAGGVTDNPDRPYEPPLLNTFMVTPTINGFEEETEQILNYLEGRKLYAKPSGHYSMMIGRFQPFHAGHAAMVQQLLDDGHEPLIALRHSPVDENNPQTYLERVDTIRSFFPSGVQVRICAIPDVKEVVYGRTVGWNMRRINLDAKTEAISGTAIRESMK